MASRCRLDPRAQFQPHMHGEIEVSGEFEYAVSRLHRDEFARSKCREHLVGPSKRNSAFPRIQLRHQKQRPIYGGFRGVDGRGGLDASGTELLDVGNGVVQHVLTSYFTRIYRMLQDGQATISAPYLPMRRDLAQPLDAGVPVLRVPAEAPRPGLLYPFGCLIHGLRLPSEPESPAARVRHLAKSG